MRKTRLFIVLGLILSISFLGLISKKSGGAGFIYIRSNGDIEGTDRIQRAGELYTFTDNISDSIVIERDDIVVDGAGYTLQGNGSGRGIYIVERNNVTIKNVIVKSFDYGIWSYFAWNCNITGNTVLECTWIGITIYYSHGCRLSANNVAENHDGIWVPHSSRNTLSHNTVTDSTYYGFYIDHESHHNDVLNNTMEYNNYGIYLAPYSYNNTFVGNNLTYNGLGVYVHGSPNNLFFHNNFTNFNQVIDSENNAVNQWDNGQSSGGNYWSDYINRYPNATEVGDTGIWDTPYVIDEYNQDNYPIVSEFSSLIMLPLFMIASFSVAFVYKRRYFKDTSP